MATEVPVFLLLFVLFAGTLISLLLMHRIGLSPFLGYITIGVMIGQGGISLLGTTDREQISNIAELGVMALMFFLGLKFSITLVRSLRRYVFVMGSIQVAVCLLVPFGLFLYFFEGEWYPALLIGAVVAMSSTAVVSELLISRGETSAPHGLRSVAVLLFQDLTVIPLLIILSIDDTSYSWQSILITIAEIVIVLSILLFVAPRTLPRLVSYVASTRSNEMLTIAILTLVTGMAILTHFAGLSLVLGAFLAGMLLAESSLRYRVEELIKPFKETLLGFFFISIGMLVNVSSIIDNIGYILLGALALLIFKPLVVYGCAKIVGSRQVTAMRSAILLGGSGEFGFVLLTAASTQIDSSLLDILIGINLIGMIAVPLVVAHLDKIEKMFARADWLIQARDLTNITTKASDLRNHVIIIGFGRSGQTVSRILKNVGIPWIAIDNDFERVQATSQAGENVVYGDARDRSLLMALGVLDATAVVIAHHMQAMAVRNIETVRDTNANVPIVAKVYAPGELDDLREAGASFVLVTSLAAGATLAEQTMSILGVPVHRIHEQMDKAKSDSQKTTGFFASVDFEEDSEALYSVTLYDDMSETGRTIGETQELIDEFGAQIMALRRGEKEISMTRDEILVAGDILVVQAVPSQYENVESAIQTGEK